MSSGLTVTGVGVSFEGLTALDDVSLKVEPGEVVGVIGPNGAGKTTLFNVICGFVQPSAGTLSYDDHPLQGHRPHDLAALGIARTLQGVGLWAGLRVVENVMAGAQARARADFASALFGLWRSSREERRLRDRAMATLERLQIAEHAERYPRELSYGIQKKVSIARALILEPTLLLLDEPASGLSGDEVSGLRSLIVDARSQAGVLLVEHQIDLVMATCDRLVVMNFGQVIATGTPDEIRANPDVTTAYLGAEVDQVESPGGPDD